MAESVEGSKTVLASGDGAANGTVSSDTSKLNGLFDIAEAAETVPREGNDQNESALKKQRQALNEDLTSVSDLNPSMPERVGEHEDSSLILTQNSVTPKAEENSMNPEDVNAGVKSPSLSSDRPPSSLSSSSSSSASSSSSSSASHQEQSSTDQKQQLQLPLRKRHLLASSSTIPDSQTADNNQALASPILDITSTDEPPATTTTGGGALAQRSPQITSKPSPSLSAKGNKFEGQLADLISTPRRIKKPSNTEPAAAATAVAAAATAPRSTGKSKSGGGGGGGGSSSSNRVKKAKQSGESNSATRLYCICMQPYDPNSPSFMICCDVCDEWYHGSCVGITQRESKKIGKYVCPKCKPTHDSTAVGGKTDGALRNKKRGAHETPNEESIKRARTDPSSMGKRISEQGVASPTSDRKCVHCNENMAKIGSKYCGEVCSMAVGRELARKKQEESSSGVSASDASDMGMLDDIARRKAEIEEKLKKLEREQQELERVIQINAKRNSGFSPPISPQSVASPTNFDSSLPSPHSNSSLSPQSPPTGHTDTSNESHQKEDSTLNGLPIEEGGGGGGGDTDSTKGTSTRKQLSGTKRKMPPSKHQQQGNEICGCPTTDFQSEYCELLRRNCVKHVNWEEMKQGTLDREKKQHEAVLSTLTQEELQVKNRMARRKERATTDAHRTIVEA